MPSSGFKTRAGTLMLLYIASAADRATLVEILAGAMSGGALRQSDEPPAEREVDEPDVLELGGVVEAADTEEDPGSVLDSDVEVPEIVLDSGLVVGPHTPMRLTPAGREMLFVGTVLEDWLRKCPEGPLELGSGRAGLATGALVCGWSGTVIHALAGGALTLPELNQAVEPLNYRVLEEHIDAMEKVGQIEPRPGRGGTRYAATDWLREGIAPLAASARMEHRERANDTAPIDQLDIEAAFSLALPLLSLPPDLSGCCRLSVRPPGGGRTRLAGATVQVEEGRISSAAAYLDSAEPDAWATGSTLAWLNAVIEADTEQLEFGGDGRLAGALLAGLHGALFGLRLD
jgi:DNA-binding HxlR family transcriptional regulator